MKSDSVTSYRRFSSFVFVCVSGGGGGADVGVSVLFVYVFFSSLVLHWCCCCAVDGDGVGAVVVVLLPFSIGNIDMGQSLARPPSHPTPSCFQTYGAVLLPCSIAMLNHGRGWMLHPSDELSPHFIFLVVSGQIYL